MSNTKIKNEEQVELIHKQLNIPKKQIREILQVYRFFALNELRNHRIFKFGYLAMIYSNEIHYKELATTTAFIAYYIASDLSLPINTVQGVLDAYIELAEVELRKGRQFNLVGLLILKPVKNEKGEVVNIHILLSKHIYSSLNLLGYRLRTRILPNFRVLIKNG